jgi:hypothetical protein
MTIRRIFSLAILGLALTSLAQSCLAREFYAIVDDFGRRPRNAHLDVSTDSVAGPDDTIFTVFNTFGAPLAQFTVRANLWGFASTASFDNLFNLTGGDPMLIRAETSFSSLPSAATLHIDSQGAPLIVGIWPTHKRDGTAFAMGREFNIALGSFRSASLSVANLGGSDQVVDIFKGTSGAAGHGIFSNPRLGPNASWRVNLTQNEALSNLIVTSTGPVIVQVVIDDGTTKQSFMVLPSP